MCQALNYALRLHSPMNTLCPSFKELRLVGERTKTGAASNSYITLTECQALF